MQFRDILGPSLPLLHTITVLLHRDKSTLLILNSKLEMLTNNLELKIPELQRTDINLSSSYLNYSSIV